MKRSTTAYLQHKRRRSQRGAALIFALAVVIIIATLSLATGRLIGEHLALEQQAEGYSRAINIAEAAVNWQLNRMSRSKLPGDNSNIPGRLDYGSVATWDFANGGQNPYTGALPFGDLGTNFDGRVQVWVRSAARGGVWTPPEDAVISALGQDSTTGIIRGAQITAGPIGLSDQYALFGINELHFDSQTGNADAGTAQLLRGYIGSNGAITNQDSNLPTGSPTYFGCRLGPQAILTPTGSSWPAGWDFPRLSDPVRMPTIDQVISYMYRGRTVADCATANDNAQIDVMADDGTFSPLRESNGSVVTQLTATQFDRSPTRHTIRLRATETAANGNLFYFTAVQMRPGDTLILDSRATFPTPTGPQHSIRILINNADPNSRITVTNLAYFQTQLPLQTAGDVNPETQSYFWYNNTPGVFEFKPSQAYVESWYTPSGANPLFRYQLDPTLRGIVYGVNSLSAANNSAGDVTIYGKAGFPVTVWSVVANHVNILGPVRVNGTSTEDNKNPNMYVLYYAIKSRTFGELSSDVDPANLLDGGHLASPVYDYGR